MPWVPQENYFFFLRSNLDCCTSLNDIYIYLLLPCGFRSKPLSHFKVARQATQSHPHLFHHLPHPRCRSCRPLCGWASMGFLRAVRLSLGSCGFSAFSRCSPSPPCVCRPCGHRMLGRTSEAAAIAAAAALVAIAAAVVASVAIVVAGSAAVGGTAGDRW